MLVGDFQKKKRRKLDRTTGLHFPSEGIAGDKQSSFVIDSAIEDSVLIKH